MNKNRILLADEDPSFRDTLKKALEAWGYGVSLFDNGEDALTAFRIERPALVLSDMLVPKLSGLELLRAIKRDHPKAIIILFTACASLTDVIAAMKEGASDIFTKPLDFRRLKMQLDQILGQADPADAESFPVPSHTGYRPPECDLQMREQRPQRTFHNAGYSTLPGGRLSAPGPVFRGR
jgi:DNA-binding NtrC family response regulator